MVGEIVTGYPGYDSIIPLEKGTIARTLKGNGYATSWFGKNHNTPGYQSSQAGPFDQWPNGMGLDYFYGFVGGDASQWQPNLFRNTTAIYPFEGNPGWNLETAMANEAIQHIKQLKELAPASRGSSTTCRARRMLRIIRPRNGWTRSARCICSTRAGTSCARRSSPTRSGSAIMPENAQLTPWPDGLPKWDSLSEEEKTLFIRQADVYGAYLAYADNEIGRVIQAVEDLGELDNTLIIYIGGDNGASAEGMINGTPNEFTTFNGVAVPVKDQFLWYPFWGSERTFPPMRQAGPGRWTRRSSG